LYKELIIDQNTKIIQVTSINNEIITGLKRVLSDKNVYRYLPFSSPPNNEEIIFFLNRIIVQTSIVWIIVFQGEIIGIIDLLKIKNGSANLAYFLSNEYHGKGIITSAINLVVKFAFNDVKLSEINAPVLSRNNGSIRVLEKNGFILKLNTDKTVNFDGNDDEVRVYTLKNKKIFK